MIKQLQKTGILDNYFYVSTKTGSGMSEIKRAILNADIEDHGDHIVPEKFEVKKKPKEYDPYENMEESEFPQIIPGMMVGGGLVRQKTDAMNKGGGRRKSSILKRSTTSKVKNNFDDVTPNLRFGDDNRF